MDHPVTKILDLASVMVVLGTLASILPAVSAGLACVYYIIQIYIIHQKRKSGKLD